MKNGRNMIEREGFSIINNLIAVKNICFKNGFSNKTVIKYSQDFKEKIKEHNLKVKLENRKIKN